MLHYEALCIIYGGFEEVSEGLVSRLPVKQREMSSDFVSQFVCKVGLAVNEGRLRIPI